MPNQLFLNVLPFLMMAGLVLPLWIRHLSMRAEMGTLLARTPAPQARYVLVAIWLFIGLLNIFMAVVDKNTADQAVQASRWPIVGLMLFCALLSYALHDGVRVYSGGITIGLLSLRRSEIAAWSWGPKDPLRESGESPDLANRSELSIALHPADPAENNRLHIWTTSGWRLLFSSWGSRPIKTTARQSPELQASMEQCAPGRQRA